MKVAIVGAGDWGRHLVRNFCELLGEKNIIVSDIDERRLREAKAQYPGIAVTQDFDSLLMDREPDAVVIATPVVTHFELAKQALLTGKHVLVEKPLALHIDEALELIELASKADRALMVDHLLE
jgi:predicted dehydrogenase